MLIASVLKNLIEDKGVTYTFISSKTGITVDAISKSLSGRRRLAADEMILICQAANIDTVSYTQVTLPTNPYV